MEPWTRLETLGAGVWGAMASEINLPWTHPLYQDLTGHMFGSRSRRTVENADAVVIVGTYVFPDVFPLLENPFRPGAKVVHIAPTVSPDAPARRSSDFVTLVRVAADVQTHHQAYRGP